MKAGVQRRWWGAAVAVAVAVGGASLVSAKNWSDWAPPANLGTLPGSSPNINSPAIDGCVSLSQDGLEIYFTSNRAGSISPAPDIWMASRASTDVGFGQPVRLPPPINSAATEFCPTIRPGKKLYFSSTRAGAGDLFVSRRTKDGWSEPQNLGPNINDPNSVDEAAGFYEDEQGREVLVFSSRREGRGQIYESIDGAPATKVAGGVNSSAADQRPGVSKDGLEIFWDSTRSGGLGNSDLYTARRTSTSEPWGTAIHLQALSSAGPPGDGFAPGFDGRPHLSWDGSTLMFGSVRAGNLGGPDTWVTTRRKVTGQSDD